MVNHAGESPDWWRGFFAARRDPYHGANSLNALQHAAETERGRTMAHREWLRWAKRYL